MAYAPWPLILCMLYRHITVVNQQAIDYVQINSDLHVFVVRHCTVYHRVTNLAVSDVSAQVKSTIF